MHHSFYRSITCRMLFKPKTYDSACIGDPLISGIQLLDGMADDEEFTENEDAPTPMGEGNNSPLEEQVKLLSSQFLSN